MQKISLSLPLVKPENSEVITVKTTLYELIEVINEEIEPEEDRLVPLIVTDLLNMGRSNS
jgi:hypothetical protein